MTGHGRDQQGFILFTALAFLVILTIIVLSTVNISSSDEKIARNSRDRDIAFAAAEAALRDAEIYISGGYQFPYALNNYATNPNYSSQLAQPEQVDFFTTTDPNYVPYIRQIGTTTLSPAIKGVSAQPLYLVEIVQVGSTTSLCNKANYVYRITAEAEGRSSNTRSTLQEFYCPP